jgi:hypothetical protein
MVNSTIGEIHPSADGLLGYSCDPSFERPTGPTRD